MISSTKFLFWMFDSKIRFWIICIKPVVKVLGNCERYRVGFNQFKPVSVFDGIRGISKASITARILNDGKWIVSPSGCLWSDPEERKVQEVPEDFGSFSLVRCSCSVSFASGSLSLSHYSFIPMYSTLYQRVASYHWINNHNAKKTLITIIIIQSPP